MKPSTVLIYMQAAHDTVFSVSVHSTCWSTWTHLCICVALSLKKVNNKVPQFNIHFHTEITPIRDMNKHSRPILLLYSKPPSKYIYIYIFFNYAVLHGPKEYQQTHWETLGHSVTPLQRGNEDLHILHPLDGQFWTDLCISAHTIIFNHCYY